MFLQECAVVQVRKAFLDGVEKYGMESKDFEFFVTLESSTNTFRQPPRVGF